MANPQGDQEGDRTTANRRCAMAMVYGEERPILCFTHRQGYILAHPGAFSGGTFYPREQCEQCAETETGDESDPRIV